MLPLLCVPVGETERAPLICGSESGRWPTKAAAAGAIMPEDGEWGLSGDVEGLLGEGDFGDEGGL